MVRLPKRVQGLLSHLFTPFLDEVTGFLDLEGLGTSTNDLAEIAHHRCAQNRVLHFPLLRHSNSAITAIGYYAEVGYSITPGK